MITFVSGNMFEHQFDIRINTVNCVGIMGAGVALAFKLRYPEMFKAYAQECKANRIVPGKLFVWKTATEWIVNFPTKRHWRNPSRYEDIESGLVALREYLQPEGNITVAIPALGCGHGGLEWDRVSKMIEQHLTVPAHISVFQPQDSRYNIH